MFNPNELISQAVQAIIWTVIAMIMRAYFGVSF